MSKSILSKYSRTPKINVRLPLGVSFYNSDIVDGSVNDIPVLPMTARDEMVLKNPDSLLNGEAVVNMIHSCVPSIKNARLVYAPDIEIIILAIIHASYGENLNYTTICPKCKHENNYTYDIPSLIDGCKRFTPPFTIEQNINGDKLIFELVPHTYETITKLGMIQFESNKLHQLISSDSLSEEDKIKEFGKSLNKMSEIQYDALINSVISIKIPEGDVTDRATIKDFFNDASPDLINKISDMLLDINNAGINTKFTASCTKCKHEWDSEIPLDPADFFVKNSNR